MLQKQIHLHLYIGSLTIATYALEPKFFEGIELVFDSLIHGSYSSSAWNILLWLSAGDSVQNSIIILFCIPGSMLATLFEKFVVLQYLNIR